VIDMDWLLARCIVTPHGCLIWLGANSGERQPGRRDTGRGYGKVRIDGIGHYVHRLVFNEMVRPVERWEEVDHLCARWFAEPYLSRLCCNPEHLEAVPSLTNQHRRILPPPHSLRGTSGRFVSNIGAE